MTITDGALTRFRAANLPTVEDASVFEPQGRSTIKIRVLRSDMPRWLPYIMSRLGELQVVEEPDDEVPTPYPEALNRALPELIRFMRIDTPTPSVVPTYEGGVQFVWHKGGWDVEVEVGPKETLVWAQLRGGGDSWDGSLDDRVGELRNLLTQLATST
jgi:hypothetical protein